MRPPGRALLMTALALGLAAGLLVGLPVAAPNSLPVAAAAGADTFVTGATTYTLDPAARMVHVSAALTFRDTKADTSTVRYYFTGYRLGIQKEAQRVKVTSGAKVLTSTVKPATDAKTGAAYQVLDITFAGRVYRGQTANFRMAYDLPDSGPRSDGLIRVGPAIAAFYAWSYGADAASVTIDLPAGFRPTTQGDALKVTTAADGSTDLTATDISDRTRWFAWVTAERPAALAAVPFEVSIEGQPEPIEIRAFPEDQVWRDAVRARLTSGLPVLGRLIGLPWPVNGTLVVSEAYAPLLGGYAGLYRQGDQPGQSDTINITEDPDPLVIVHEASHAWFNADLFTGRWIAEGLADEYASRALADLGQSGYDPEQVQPTDEAGFALDAWPAPGPIDQPAAAAAERFGYNASWTVVRSLLTEIGEARMAAVLKAAQARTIAYAGRPPAETYLRAGAAPDWHVFLDLLEQVGGSHAAEGLFRTWVAGPADQADLAAHGEAISAYAALLQRGQGWLPGAAVRQAMAAWDFPAAERAMAAAAAVLATRERIVSLAGSLGLTTSDALEAAYESAATGFASAQALADEQLATLQAIAHARATVGAERDVLTTLGLVDAHPEADLAAAAAAFEAGRLPEARADAAAAERFVGDAPAIGRQRLLAVAAGLLGLFVLAGIVLLLLRRRRGRSRAAAQAAATLPASRGARPQATRDDGPVGPWQHRDGPGPPGP
ncbi:MAG: hypothetical protein ACRDGL_11460 [Candidatus Limnocylindrales bacterium]